MAFADVLERELVGLDRRSAISRFLVEKAARLGRPMRLRAQLRGFEAVCRLVEARVGLAILPESTALRAARTLGITVVPLSDPWARRDLTLCLRTSPRSPPSCATSSTCCGGRIGCPEGWALWRVQGGAPRRPRALPLGPHRRACPLGSPG